MMMDLRWHFGGILGVLEATLGLKNRGGGFQLANNPPRRPHRGGEGGVNPSLEGAGRDRG